jgi:DNA-binding PadR family transcriptional regulator
MFKKLLVMGLLLDGPRHGYEINKLIKGPMQKAFDLNPASTYYTLEKLEQKGFVDKSETQQDKRPRKIVYRLSPSGKEEFYRLLESALSSKSDPVYPMEVGLVFIDKLAPTESIRLLENRIDDYRGRLAKLEALKQKGFNVIVGGPIPDHRWMIEHKISHLKAEIEWEERFLIELTSAQV